MLKKVLIKTFQLTTSRRLDSLQSTRNYVRRMREPGIEKRLKQFSDDFLKHDEDDFESDFLNVNEAHKQFEDEERKHKDNIEAWIVGNKYFKDKSPNFLTYSEKEQIKMLHEQNADEWTLEKLSESFPADPLAISKIIKSKWHPRDDNRIQKHDESVKLNWQKYKNGELEVEPVLSEHLQKFANRNFKAASAIKVSRRPKYELPMPKSNEFSSIITSCKKYSEQEPEAKKLQSRGNKIPEKRPNPENDSYIIDSPTQQTSKMMTLKAFQDISPDVMSSEKSLMNDSNKDGSQNLRVFKQKDNDNVTTLSQEDASVFRSLEIKEQIRIPRRLWKKDRLFRVGDCFYDDDGEFLYRVPGLM